MCKPNVLVVNGPCCEETLRNSLRTTEIANIPVVKPNVAMGKMDGKIVVMTDDQEMTMLLSGLKGWRGHYGADTGREKRVVVFYPPQKNIRQVIAQIAERAGEPAALHRV